MNNPIYLLTFVAALGSGLVAGIFFAFSNFVMKALARVPPEQGVAAMQSINVVVLNRWFFAVFFGTAACCLALAITSFVRWQKPGAGYLLAGSLLYLIGTIIVTIACNVPLNEALAGVDPSSADAGPVWSNYLKIWTAWNHVRTIAALAAAASFTVALCQSHYRWSSKNYNPKPNSAYGNSFSWITQSQRTRARLHGYDLRLRPGR